MNKQKLSIKIASAIEYYHKDVTKRCTNEGGSCYYSGKTLGLKTKGCLIGQLLPTKTRELLDKDYKEKNVCVINRDAPQLLPQYIRDNIVLFRAFQGLHDGDWCWNEQGLSQEGKELLTSIIKDYDLDREIFIKKGLI